MNVQYIQANGLRFAYLELGTGPLVMFLHGFPDNAWSYKKQMQVFGDAGYRVVCPFLRGYAPTEVPKSGSCDPATLAKDVEALIRALSPSEKAWRGPLAASGNGIGVQPAGARLV